jgi:hypothetical protein
MTEPTNKEKGNLLEDVYYMFEKALESTSNKTIKKNAIVKDRFGQEREVDILIEFQVDKYKTTKFAVECKNHTSGIPIKELTDFYSKIEGTDMHGIFVTSSYYQSGAIEAAKQRHIQLLTFKKEESPKAVLHGIIMGKRIRPIPKSFQAISNDYTEAEMQNIFTNDVEFIGFINQVGLTHLMPYVHSNIEEIVKTQFPEWDGIGNKINYVGIENAKRIGICCEFHDVVFRKGNKSLELTNIVCELLVWEECHVKENHEQYSYSLIELETQKVLAIISPTLFSIGDVQMHGALVELPQENNKMRMGISTSNCIEDMHFENIPEGVDTKGTPLEDFFKNFPRV